MLRNLKIGTRLNLGFGVVITLLCIMGIYAIRQVGTLSNTMDNLYDHSYVYSNAVRDANTHILEMYASMKDMCLTDSSSTVDALLAKVNRDEGTVDGDLKSVEELSGDNKQDAQAVTVAFNVWRPAHDEVCSLIKANKRPKAIAVLNGQATTDMRVLEQKMDDLIAKADLDAKASKSHASQVASNAHRGTIASIIVIALLGFAIAFIITQSITRLLQEGIPVLVSSASEIAATASQLASSATETASSVSETTAAVEQVKQTALLATEKAKDVSDRAQQTLQVSQIGEDAVESTIGGIHQIREQMNLVADSVVRLSEQSQTIGEIIESVDDLAEQSNLLAVNAAIEAAKAGEQGKGFAVVAREVKNLAEQSRQATRQVRTILTDIQKATSSAVMATEQSCKSVEDGVTHSVQVGDALKTLAQNIGESAEMASGIAASSEQQYSGIDQVTTAMESIKEAATQNVAGARQLEEASRNLSTVGWQLEQLVSRKAA